MLFWTSKGAVGFPPISRLREHMAFERRLLQEFQATIVKRNMRFIGVSEHRAAHTWYIQKHQRCFHAEIVADMKLTHHLFTFLFRSILAISVIISPVFCSKQFPCSFTFSSLSVLLGEIFLQLWLARVYSRLIRMLCMERWFENRKTQDIGCRVITFLPLIVAEVGPNYVDGLGLALFLGNIGSGPRDLGREGQCLSHRLEKQQHHTCQRPNAFV